MSGQLLVLEYQGHHSLVPLAPERDQLPQLYALIGCTWVEMLPLAPDLDVWLDEEGKLDGKPINALATQIGRHLRPDLLDVFVGTVVFAQRSGPRMVGLTPERIAWLTEFIEAGDLP